MLYKQLKSWHPEVEKPGYECGKGGIERWLLSVFITKITSVDTEKYIRNQIIFIKKVRLGRIE